MHKIFTFVLMISSMTMFAQERADIIQDLRVDVIYLASDYLAGRETGTRGEDLAAQYIISRFEEAGLQPKGTDGDWLQPFDFKFNPNNNNPHTTSDTGEDRIGKNVVGYIDNGAENTVVIGAHYDHLGLGHFGSRNAGKEAIHNGADDNASGIAAMFRIANYLKAGNAKNNNYLFIAFSGEELGLFGSKFYVNNPTIDMSKVSYMLNMDMVGRLNKEKTLVITGVGTSPRWKEVLPEIEVGGINIKTTDSGIGPSDHTSFYLKDIPVLHFFTGQHMHYHKPEDDSELVNYEGLMDICSFMIQVIEKLDNDAKLVFTKTKDESKDREVAAFKVTLGVMPDYTYQGEGMKVDAVLDGRPAKNGGLENGDVIIKIGDTDVKDIYVYMECLSKYEVGDKVKVTVLRGKKKKKVKKEITF